MIKYFKELLVTLKRVERHLDKIASTVSTQSRGENYINTDHKNPKY